VIHVMVLKYIARNIHCQLYASLFSVVLTSIINNLVNADNNHRTSIEFLCRSYLELRESYLHIYTFTLDNTNILENVLIYSAIGFYCIIFSYVFNSQYQVSKK